MIELSIQILMFWVFFSPSLWRKWVSPIVSVYAFRSGIYIIFNTST
jgi:hypothetical protein